MLIYNISGTPKSFISKSSLNTKIYFVKLKLTEVDLMLLKSRETCIFTTHH